jgi:hypothetical protein
MAAPMPADAKLRVAQKVRALVREEKVDAKQAFATAMSMEKSGRLEEGGVYKRAPKSKHAYANRAHANVNEGYND